MQIDLTGIVMITSIIMSLFVAFLSVKIYRYNRLSKAWIAVTLAFILVVVRRSIGFAVDYRIFSGTQPFPTYLEAWLQLLISFLYIAGFWSMKKNFERFDVVEKQARAKAEAFEKTKQSARSKTS